MKLLPCPFCGSDDIKTQSGTGIDLMTQYNGRYVYCSNCGVFMQVTRYSEWNNRTPIVKQSLSGSEQSSSPKSAKADF